MPLIILSGDFVVKHNHWDDGNRCKENTNDTAQSCAAKESDDGKQNRCDDYAEDQNVGERVFKVDVLSIIR